MRCNSHTSLSSRLRNLKMFCTIFVQGEPDYDRWQLVAEPITLEEFNLKPHLSPAFFELGMEVVGEVPTTPWIIQDQGVLRIKAWDVIRYKVRGIASCQ